MTIATNEIERGRRLVEAREGATAMLDLQAMSKYFRQQRAVVARRGRCDGGCSPDCLTTLPNGRVVCFRTHEPCPAVQLPQQQQQSETQSPNPK